MDSITLFILAILAGFALLIWSSDRFVDGAADLARYYGVSPILVGMLIIGFGTSAPEMLVSAVAAFNGTPAMGIGNAIGSNITNITLVLGITAIFYALPVHSQIIRVELPILLITSLLAMYLLASGEFGLTDGIILLFTLTIVLSWMIVTAKSNPDDDLMGDIEEHFPAAPHHRSALFWTIAGLALLVVSSQLLVWGASHLAERYGVSDLVIGLTIVAVGTSLPEVAATIMSAKKGETDLAIGNIVGSNLFNTLGVLALPAIISPHIPDTNAVYRDMPITLLLTLVLLTYAWGFGRGRIISFWKGLSLFATFIGFQSMLFYHSVNQITCVTLLCL